MFFTNRIKRKDWEWQNINYSGRNIGLYGFLLERQLCYLILETITTPALTHRTNWDWVGKRYGESLPEDVYQ